MVGSVGKFNPKIESLRGLAALAVVVTHSLAVLPVDGSAAFWTLPYLDRTLDQLLLTAILVASNAGAAVVLFFVISGYVLALSLQSRDLAPYLISRAFRLLPPMWASIGLFFVVAHLLPASRYEIPTITDALKNMLLLDFKANPVTWTMYVEVIGSLLVPLMCVVFVRFRAPALIAFISFWLVALALNFPAPTISYVGCFACGVAISILPRPAIPVWAWVGAGVLAFCLSWTLPIGPHWIILDTAGAYLVVSGVLAKGREVTILDLEPLRFMGRVSYSLYLIHLPAIVCVSGVAQAIGVAELPWLLPHIAILIATVALSLAMAAMMFFAVERPSMVYGREVASLRSQVDTLTTIKAAR